MALPIIVIIGGIAIKYATKELAKAAAKNIGGRVISKPTKAMIDKAVSPRKALTNNPTLLDKIKSQIGISPKQSKSMPLVGRSDKNAGINVGKLERTASERRSQLKVGIPLALIAGKIGYDMGKDKDTKKPTTKSKTKTYAEMVKEDKAKGKAKVLARRDSSEKPEPKSIPKGLRESIAKDKKKAKPTPKKKPVAKKIVEEKKKKQLMMKEKYTGKDSNVKFNSRGGMLKKGKK